MPASGAETSRGPPRCSSPGGDHIVPCPTGLSELGCPGVLGPPEQPGPRARPSRREGPGPRPGLPTRPVCQEVGQAPGPGGGKQVTEGREVEVAEAEAALLRTPGAPSAPPRARGPASSSQARGQRPEARDQRRPAAGRPAPGSGALSRWRTQGNAEPPFRQGTGAQGEGDRDRGQTPGLGPRRGLRHAPPPHTPPALPGPRARASDPVQPTRCPVRALGPLAGSAPVCGVSRPEACPHLGPHPPPSLPPRPSGARTDVPPHPPRRSRSPAAGHRAPLHPPRAHMRRPPGLLGAGPALCVCVGRDPHRLPEGPAREAGPPETPVREALHSRGPSGDEEVGAISVEASPPRPAGS